MMVAPKTAIAAVALTLVLETGPVIAAEPTSSDFDACNRAAQAKVASGSASPQTGGATGPTLTTPAGTPDTTAGVQPGGQGGKTGPMITGSGRSPGSPGGVREGTGAVSSGGEDASSRQLRGISEALKGDAAAREAYRQCMRERGF